MNTRIEPFCIGVCYFTKVVLSYIDVLMRFLRVLNMKNIFLNIFWSLYIMVQQLNIEIIIIIRKHTFTIVSLFVPVDTSASVSRLQSHLLSRISYSTDFCPTRSHKSSFVFCQAISCYFQFLYFHEPCGSVDWITYI